VLNLAGLNFKRQFRTRLSSTLHGEMLVCQMVLVLSGAQHMLTALAGSSKSYAKSRRRAKIILITDE